MAADWLAYTPGEPAGVARRKMDLPLLLPRVPSPALRRGAKPLWRRSPTVCIRRQQNIAAEHRRRRSTRGGHTPLTGS